MEKAEEWVTRDEEYIKRAGFALIATLAMHSDQLTNSDFTRLLLLITENVSDERHYVKKGASWAIREIGKRDHHLSIEAIETAEKLKKSDSTFELWIARDVLKDLK